MFYKNKLQKREAKTIFVTFDNLKNNPEPTFEPKDKKANTTKISYNYKVSNGVLEDGYGFQNLQIPYSSSDSTMHEVAIDCDEIIGLWCFRWFDENEINTQTYIFYLDASYHLYYFYEYERFGGVIDSEIVFTSYPTAFPYRVQDSNMFILSSATDDLIAYGGGTHVFQFENTPHIASNCIHENSFYGILATDDSKLIYTKELLFPNIDETEFTELLFKGGEGERLRKLFSLNDYVYLFRDNGIVKLYPYSTNSSLSISHVYYSSALILPESIQRCGDQILFLTRDGLYTFNGSTAKKIDLEIFDKIDMSSYQTFTSASQKGKYFLACKINFEDDEKVLCETSELGYKNNALLVFDPQSESLEIVRGVDIRDLEAIETPVISKMICCFYNDHKSQIAELTNDGRYFGEVMPKRWTSVETDFGYKGKTKVIKNVNICASKDCKVKIESDRETKTFNIAGKDKIQKIKLGVRGETFSISFITQEVGQKISNPEFEVDVLL